MSANLTPPEVTADPTPDQAREQIATLRGDPAWIAAYISGDKEKAAHFTRLHDIAHGAAPAGGLGGVDSTGPSQSSATPPAAPGNQPVTESGVLEPGMPGFEEANLAAFAAPRGPADYQFRVLEGANLDDAGVQEQMEIQQALYAEAFPPFAAHAIDSAIIQIAKAAQSGRVYIGEPGKVACMEALTTRHGAGAKAIIADACKVFARLDARSSKLGDLLTETGAANHPEVIETLARVWRDYYAKRS